MGQETEHFVGIRRIHSADTVSRNEMKAVRSVDYDDDCLSLCVRVQFVNVCVCVCEPPMAVATTAAAATAAVAVV